MLCLKQKYCAFRHLEYSYLLSDTRDVIEIINNTRGGIEGKIGEPVFAGKIQVSDVHSFMMSQTKNRFRQVFLLFKLFFTGKILKISLKKY